MRCPWVARSTLDATYSALTDLRAINAQAFARYDALLAKYHALIERPTGPAPTALEPRKADPVAETIALVGGSNGRTRRALGAWAKEQRLAGVDTQSIVDGLMHWPSDEDGVAA